MATNRCYRCCHWCCKSCVGLFEARWRKSEKPSFFYHCRSQLRVSPDCSHIRIVVVDTPHQISFSFFWQRAHDTHFIRIRIPLNLILHTVCTTNSGVKVCAKMKIPSGWCLNALLSCCRVQSQFVVRWVCTRRFVACPIKITTHFCGPMRYFSHSYVTPNSVNTAPSN